jgi:lysyl-tRNA synthetase, class II
MEMSGTPTHTDSADPGAAAQDTQAGTDERLAKMQRLRAEGVEPFPYAEVSQRTPVQAIAAAHDAGRLTPGEHPEAPYTVAGRIVGRRGHGKKTFLDLQDGSGQVQLYATLDGLGQDAYARVLDLDIGDIVSASGCLYVTQRGQLALSLHELTLLTKALATPPARYHGVQDDGTRHRYRELDLMANQETRDLFLLRTRTIEALRAFLAEQGFIEVETPVLQSLAGGASARPFTTHHNALDSDLSLRISVELYLNRCLIGGLENVYDLGKCFRNEGISYRHSPEFTMLEWLQSYSDYRDVARLTEEMVADVARRASPSWCRAPGGQEIDLAVWRHTTMQEEVLRVTGLDILDSDAEKLIELLGDHREKIRPGQGSPEGALPSQQSRPDAGLSTLTWAQAVHAIYTKLVEQTILAPTIVSDFPGEPFVITKSHRRHPQLAEHFDAVIGGIELVSGDSELTDPVEQHRRFVEQRRGRGDEADEAHPHDEEYVRSLEYGLAPSASGGMGVDRLIMILSGRQTLREVLPFPTMKELR